LGYLLSPPQIPDASDKQIALFTQFAGTIRDKGSELSQQPGNTLLSYERKHHWAWFIPVTEELTSVGVVFRTEYFTQARPIKGRDEVTDLSYNAYEKARVVLQVMARLSGLEENRRHRICVGSTA